MWMPKLGRLLLFAAVSTGVIGLLHLEKDEEYFERSDLPKLGRRGPWPFSVVLLPLPLLFLLFSADFEIGRLLGHPETR